jgi:hypothetical protein
MEGPNSEDGTWLYDAVSNQYKVDNQVFSVELCNDNKNFTLKMPALEENESVEVTVWKKKE